MILVVSPFGCPVAKRAPKAVHTEIPPAKAAECLGASRSPVCASPGNRRFSRFVNFRIAPDWSDAPDVKFAFMRSAARLISLGPTSEPCAGGKAHLDMVLPAAPGKLLLGQASCGTPLPATPALHDEFCGFRTQRRPRTRVTILTGLRKEASLPSPSSTRILSGCGREWPFQASSATSVQ